MIVQKYGGSSVATLEKIEKIADNIKRRLCEVGKVIVVVSAMKGETDELINMSNVFGRKCSKRDVDQLVSLGENKTAVLLSLCLQNLGVRAVSLTGWQAGIITNDNFNNAYIEEIETTKINQKLNLFDVVVVTGFQGVTRCGDITTLGKGGSDTTAVAIASQFGCRCEIYTDVCGVFSADPKVLPNAKKINSLSYDELVEMSANGAKVMETRSVEIAKKFNVELWVSESLKSYKLGTKVQNEKLEDWQIKNITIKNDVVECCCEFLNLLELKKIFQIISNENLKFETKNLVFNKKYYLKLIIENKFLKNLEKILIKNKILYTKNDNLCKISLIGNGIKIHKEIIESVFNVFQNLGVEVESLDLSELTANLVIEKKYEKKVVNMLARKFGLIDEKINLAIVGATGLVGGTFLKVLEERKIKNKIENVFLFASKKSAGKKIAWCGKELIVEELNKDNIKNKKIDFAFFSAGEGVAKSFAPFFVKCGIGVIDNSSAFRMEKSVPLIVPEVNFEETESKIISNPNCSTIQCMFPLKILQDNFGLKRVDFVTYQAVSGSGVKGILDLQNTAEGKEPNCYPYAIFDNCIPHIGSFCENGFSSEEIKMINETKKILQDENLEVSATCVRVPVKNCHCVAVKCELKNECDVEKIKMLFNETSGLVLCDDVEKNLYPINELANGKDEIFVGRIRKDLFNLNIVHFWCVADNVRKGAATNGVQILEKILKNN